MAGASCDSVQPPSIQATCSVLWLEHTSATGSEIMLYPVCMLAECGSGRQALQRTQATRQHQQHRQQCTSSLCPPSSPGGPQPP